MILVLRNVFDCNSFKQINLSNVSINFKTNK